MLSCKNSSYNFYIESLEKFNIDYIDIKNNTREADTVLFCYHYEKKGNKRFPVFLEREYGVTKDILENEILEPLNNIFFLAREQRFQAFSVFTRNPFLPWWKILFCSWKSFSSYHFLLLVNASSEKSCFVSSFLYLYYLFVYYFLFTLICFLCLFLFMIDVIMCRLDCFRNCEKEHQWLAEQMEKNPSLETSEIHKLIVSEMEKLKLSLEQSYPTIRIRLQGKQQRIHREGHWHTIKQFHFRISRPSKDHHRASSRSVSRKSSYISNYTIPVPPVVDHYFDLRCTDTYGSSSLESV
jgi:hypothetical protein